MSSLDIISRLKALEERVLNIERLQFPPSPGAWVDYSATSTIVGWTSYTNKEIYYKRTGARVEVMVQIEGVSNSTTTTFTLPYSPTTGPMPLAVCWVRDNNIANVGYLTLSGTTATVKPDMTGGAWTASGNKGLYTQFWYETT